MGYNWFYYLKKAYALYPGIDRPISAAVLAEHYARRRSKRSKPRALLDAAVGGAFQWWIPLRARHVQKRFGLDDAWRQRAVAVARAAVADPNELVLFRIDSAAGFATYIRRYEDAALNKIINPLGWTRHCALADKHRFAERCAAAGLPHPPTVATVVAGRVQVLADPAGRPLMAKPVDGEGGSGIRSLGIASDVEALRSTLHEARLRGSMVIQPRVETHPALHDVALSALPTVRIVTILDEHDTPEVVSATFRCPTDARALVDNMKAGGLIAPVSLETGCLGIACFGYGGDDHRVHPVTGAPIEGRRLPAWPEACALVVRAHAEAFRDYALIGWDVALTPQGPILIEGNGKPGVLMPQRAARQGLAQGRYGALLAWHLARAESATT